MVSVLNNWRRIFSQQSGAHFLTDLTAFVNMVLVGQCPASISQQSAVGCWPWTKSQQAFARLVSKCAHSFGSRRLQPDLCLLSLLWLFTVRSMTLLRATCPNNFVTLLTCQPEPVFGHRRSTYRRYINKFIYLSIYLSSTSLLDVRPSRRVTVGDRSFATAGPRIWNTLLRDVTTATSLLSFRRKLKTHLFRQSYPDILVWLAP